MGKRADSHKKKKLKTEKDKNYKLGQKNTKIEVKIKS